MQPVADGRWRYYSFSELGTDERMFFIGRCLGSEEGEWAGCSERRSLCALYENQDGWLCLCFEPEEAPYQRHVRGGDYVRVWSTYTLWAETRAGLLHEYWGHFGDDNPEIPGFIAPVPEVEDQHRETGYDR